MMDGLLELFLEQKETAMKVLDDSLKNDTDDVVICTARWAKLSLWGAVDLLYRANALSVKDKIMLESDIENEIKKKVGN